MEVNATGQCPLCGERECVSLSPSYRGRCVTSQLAYIDDLSLMNMCCQHCGFIFNAEGMRGKTQALYTPEVWKPKPQVMNFDAQGKKTQQERALDVFCDLCALPATGHVLDFGAGRGDFLRYFAHRFPRWTLHALEPGGGFEALCRALPACDAYNQPFYEVTLPQPMDAIVVMSVLEHVENPLQGLRWIADNLAEGGVALLQHPNFAAMPGDLFCVDHISKLTVPHFAALCSQAGLRVQAQKIQGVMFAFACVKQSAAPLPWPVAEQMTIAAHAQKSAGAIVECVRQTFASAERAHGRSAIFGTSPIGYMAPMLLGKKTSVTCFVDENTNVQGSLQDGIPVVGPDQMKDLGITDVALAISPHYWDMVAEKLKKFDVRVHRPQ